MKILFETKFGSHVYGTNSPASDTDFKGIYVPEVEDVILGRAKETVVLNEKNSLTIKNQAGDIDREFKSLHRFILDACKNQTYAIDMLWTPEEFWITSSPEWSYLVKNRHLFLTKNIVPFVGYAQRQAAKYGLKGSRLASLESLINSTAGLNGTIGDNINSLQLGEYVKIEEKQGVMFLKVLEKYFPFNSLVKALNKSCISTYKKYGSRAQLAQINEGVDWKAISHAYRAAYQIIELAKHKHISFPLAQAEFLKDVKYGKVSWDIVKEDLAKTIDLAKNTMNKSDLPKNNCPVDVWEDFIVNTTLHAVNF